MRNWSIRTLFMFLGNNCCIMSCFPHGSEPGWAGLGMCCLTFVCLHLRVSPRLIDVSPQDLTRLTCILIAVALLLTTESWLNSFSEPLLFFEGSSCWYTMCLLSSGNHSWLDKYFYPFWSMLTLSTSSYSCKYDGRWKFSLCFFGLVFHFTAEKMWAESLNLCS